MPTNGKKGLVKREPWDPFRMMMPRIFENFFEGHPFRDWGLELEGGRSSWFPAVNVEAKEKEYIFRADVPGLEKENVDVAIEGGILKLTGERKTEKEEKTKTYLRREQYEGRFERSFSLPDDAVAEGVKAEYKNGVLTVHVPRSEEKKAKSLKVSIE